MKLTIPLYTHVPRFAAAATMLMIVFSSPVSAGPPECPCWLDGAVGLAADATAKGDLLECTAHPQPYISPESFRGIEARLLMTLGYWEATVVSPGALPGSSPGNHDARCNADGNVSFSVSVGEVWACIRDINTVCRALTD
jgi:hypothetical protein